MRWFVLFLATLSFACQHPAAVQTFKEAIAAPNTAPPSFSSQTASASTEKSQEPIPPEPSLSQSKEASALEPLEILPLDENPPYLESLPPALQNDVALVKSEALRIGLAGFETNSSTAAPVCGLDCQTERYLAQHVPFKQQQWLGAHNAYNHRGIFKNQFWDIHQQLDAGVRVLELDLHRSLFSSKVRVCHGTGWGDCLLNPFGVRDYQEILKEIKMWSDQHPDQLLIIELENHVKRQAAVEEPLRQTFGSLLYAAAERPPHWETETPAQIVARGKRIIVADFGPLRFDGQLIWDQNLLSTNTPSGHFEPDCRVLGKPMGEKAWGFYDDKTFHKPNPITPKNIQTFLRCQARYLKLDRINNELLAASRFSWPNASPDQACAQLSASQFRWQAAYCQQVRPFACQTDQGWKITSSYGPWAQGQSFCHKEFGSQAEFGVPRTWYQNYLLHQQIPAQTEVWLNFEYAQLTSGSATFE